MGAEGSKLILKDGISLLISNKYDLRSSNELEEWSRFYTTAFTCEDVFTVLTNSDIRTLRNTNPANFKLLIEILIRRLVFLSHNAEFTAEDSTRDRDRNRNEGRDRVLVTFETECLNCVRLLTRLFPFVYESEDEEIAVWEQSIWEESEDGEMLGEKLINAVVSLLFVTGFTVPYVLDLDHRVPQYSVKYELWEDGVGSGGAKRETGDVRRDSNYLIENRLEMLRLMISVCSKGLYKQEESKFLTGIMKLEKVKMLHVSCSLLNTALHCRDRERSRFVVNSAPAADLLVTYCRQFTALLLVYSNASQKNMVRHYFSKIHKKGEIDFLVESIFSLVKSISGPATLVEKATDSVTHGTTKRRKDTLIAVWELLQCNSKLRQALCCKRETLLEILVVFLSICSKCSSSFKGKAYQIMAVFDRSSDENIDINLLRISSAILFYLTSIPEVSQIVSSNWVDVNLIRNYFTDCSLSILSPIEYNMESFQGTYYDFFITVFYSLMKSSAPAMSYMLQDFSRSVYNLAIQGKLMYLNSSKFLIDLILEFSRDSVLFRKQELVLTRYRVLCALLDALCLLITTNPGSNFYVTFNIYKNENRIVYLHDHLINGLERYNTYKQLNGTNKSTDSFPAGTGGKLAGKQRLTADYVQVPRSLDLLLMFLKALKSELRGSNPSDSVKTAPELKADDLLEAIKSLPYERLSSSIDTSWLNNCTHIPFQWTPTSLRWYQSLIWAAIFENEIPSSKLNLSLHLPSITKSDRKEGLLTAKIFSSTNITLFRVQSMNKGINLLQPQGAIDAIADKMIEGIGMSGAGKRI